MSGAPLCFVPWIRQGAAGLVAAIDPIAPATAQDELDARVELDVAVGINTSAPGGGALAQVKLRLYGPGDVRGLDNKQIIRTEPVANASDFEPNYFPFIEFDRPDLPWLFTPAAARADGRLRPWICLVVVPADKGSIVMDPARPLPVLHVTEAGTELPDLAESWAWAHGQIAGDDIAGALASGPQLTLSRLMCPRRLQPRTSHVAAVVPAFNTGVAAGLGQAQDDSVIGKLGPAWTAAATAIDLPVYFHWEFATGAAGDFEELVTRLQRIAGNVVTGLGARDILITDPGGGLPAITDGATPPAPAAIPVAGVLIPAGTAPQPVYPDVFTAALEALVNASPAQTLPAGLALPPPLYGRWHAAQSTIPPAGGAVWLRELNLSPHLRLAAGLGAQIVHEQQEELMTSAWQQAGAIDEANQLLRQGQLARDAARSRFQRVSSLPDAALVLFAGPALARVVVGPDASQPAKLSALGRVTLSRVPPICTAGVFRRAARPRGPLSRRIASAAGAALLPERLLTRFNASNAPPRPRTNPAGMITVGRAVDQTLGAGLPRLCQITRQTLTAQAKRLSSAAALTPSQKSWFAAASDHQGAMAPCAPLEPPPPRPALDIAAVAAAVRDRLNPDRAVAAVIGARVQAPGWKPADALAPIMAAPVFPTPMYRALAALSQDYLLAGMERLPNNSITSVETNPAFVAAFMAGLNHEMSRVLLWREFPTDQRGTYFRQFWDPSTRVPPPATDAEVEAAKDIARMDAWPAAAGIDSASANGTAPSTGEIVLLIRGDLIKRYARASVYVARGEWYDTAPSGAAQHLWRRRPVTTAPETNERYPIFQGALPPDTTFMGFGLNQSDALGRSVNAQGNPIDDAGQEIADPVADDRAGWFVVLQQAPTEPRFGLDETGAANAAAWSDLGWTNVSLAGNHISLAAALTGVDPGFAQSWPPANGAALAAGMLQGPLRAAIHLSDLMGVVIA